MHTRKLESRSLSPVFQSQRRVSLYSQQPSIRNKMGSFLTLSEALLFPVTVQRRAYQVPENVCNYVRNTEGCFSCSFGSDSPIVHKHPKNDKTPSFLILYHFQVQAAITGYLNSAENAVWSLRKGVI